MAGGYVGKILNVDLASGSLAEEPLEETLCRQYVGGYGVGARLLYDQFPANVDPLGPENVLGFMTGPLTGTPALIGSRFVVLGKSPKTDTWGEDALRRLDMEFLLADAARFEVPAVQSS